MIQDIFPHKLYNQYDKEAKPQLEDTVLNIHNGNILMLKKDYDEGRIEFPHVSDFGLDCEYIYLFSVDDNRYFLLEGKCDEDKLPDGTEYIADRNTRIEGIGPDENLFAAITGKHLSDWYRDSKYCGRCGNKMIHSLTERAMHCDKCGNTVYPRIMPAVIVGVKNGDRLLITRYKTGFAHNALIAGFTEIGETMEETVQREVMEEAGIKVKNITYYKSQPWGSANDILIGYYCEVDGNDEITMDSEELKYAEWVKREDIVLQPGSFSLTNEMMKMFKEGLIV